MRRYNLIPVPKPRQTRSDKWKKRPCVIRYREFKDAVRLLGLSVPAMGCRMIFVLPMPASWSKKKKEQMRGVPHQQKPDTDNMVKAVLDAVHDDDSGIYHFEAIKFWGDEGAIYIDQIHLPMSFIDGVLVTSDNAGYQDVSEKYAKLGNDLQKTLN